MWRKFLARKHLRFGTRVAVTAVKFGANRRRDWPMERRAAEVKEWAARVADPCGRDDIVQMALGGLSRSSYSASVGKDVSALRMQLKAKAKEISKLQQRVKCMKQTWSWRLTRPFRKAARLLDR
ncbi:hypothetical protein [Dongia deserti]|uniref:hypothetical protein n=1 Tax=Dongia deserti TaxID=2268030 RepID=UPI000E64DED7|nr:hypothetical protein [Dongia deserti]